jgi:hypothetical protein
MGQDLVCPGRGRALDRALAGVAAGWLDVAQAWTGLHTSQPATPTKIAASRSLGQALMASTRDGADWADRAVVARRMDVGRTLAALRRAPDVGRQLAEAQPQMATRLAASGLSSHKPVRSAITGTARRRPPRRTHPC